MRETILVNGIILSSMPVGEADRRLSLLTKELGKISCFARGARRPTSRFVGETRPFAFGTFELLPGHDAYTLYNAEITEYFEPVVTDLTLSAYGSLFLELAGRMSHENTDGGPELALLYYALRALTKKAMTPELIRTVFVAKTLEYEGLFPEFSVCAKCRKPVEKAVFRPALMQILCPECEGGNDALYPLSRSALYAFSFIRGTAPKTLFSFTVKPEVEKEIGEVTAVILDHALEKPLRSAELIELLAAAGGENQA